MKYALQIHQYIYLSVICLFSLSFGSISLLMLFHLLSFTWFLLIDFCFNLFFPYCPYAQVRLSMCISDSLILSNQSEQVLIYSRKKKITFFFKLSYWIPSIVSIKCEKGLTIILSIYPQMELYFLTV